MNMIFPLTCFMYYFDRSLLKIPMYLYGGIYFTLGVGSVSVYTLAIKYRLDSLTVVLKRFLKPKGNVKFIQVLKMNDVDVISALADIYNDLMDMCDEINVCFGYQLMISFGLVFFYTLFTTFSAYTDLVNEGFLAPTTISSACFCIYCNFFLSLVIMTCSMVENLVRWFKMMFIKVPTCNSIYIPQAIKISKLLSESLKHTIDPLQQSMLLSFSWLVKRRKPIITCGLFDFNWKLTFSIISGAATNFIILMQFDLASRRTVK